MLMTADFVLECGTEIVEALVFRVPHGECFVPTVENSIQSLAELESVVNYGDNLGFNTGTAYGIINVSAIVSYSAHVEIVHVDAQSCGSCECTCGDDA